MKSTERNKPSLCCNAPSCLQVGNYPVSPSPFRCSNYPYCTILRFVGHPFSHHHRLTTRSYLFSSFSFALFAPHAYYGDQTKLRLLSLKKCTKLHQSVLPTQKNHNGCSTFNLSNKHNKSNALCTGTNAVRLLSSFESICLRTFFSFRHNPGVPFNKKNTKKTPWN